MPVVRKSCSVAVRRPASQPMSQPSSGLGWSRESFPQATSPTIPTNAINIFFIVRIWFVCAKLHKISHKTLHSLLNLAIPVFHFATFFICKISRNLDVQRIFFEIRLKQAFADFLSIPCECQIDGITLQSIRVSSSSDFDSTSSIRRDDAYCFPPKLKTNKYIMKKKFIITALLALVALHRPPLHRWEPIRCLYPTVGSDRSLQGAHPSVLFCQQRLQRHPFLFGYHHISPKP